MRLFFIGGIKNINDGSQNSSARSFTLPIHFLTVYSEAALQQQPNISSSGLILLSLKRNPAKCRKYRAFLIGALGAGPSNFRPQALAWMAQ